MNTKELISNVQCNFRGASAREGVFLHMSKRVNNDVIEYVCKMKTDDLVETLRMACWISFEFYNCKTIQLEALKTAEKEIKDNSWKYIEKECFKDAVKC